MHFFRKSAFKKANVLIKKCYNFSNFETFLFFRDKDELEKPAEYYMIEIYWTFRTKMPKKNSQWFFYEYVRIFFNSTFFVYFCLKILFVVVRSSLILSKKTRRITKDLKFELNRIRNE